MKEVKKFPVGGTHLPEEKGLTSGLSIEPMGFVGKVRVPLKQHIGVAVKPCVKAGDQVRPGTLLGSEADGLHARVHSGVTGRVEALTEIILATGETVPAVSIVCTEDTDPEELFLTPLQIDYLGGAALQEAVCLRAEEAGLVGLGGASFPSHVKLALKDPVDTVIINGAECEPYITVDDRLMQEEADTLFRGLEIIRNLFGAEKGYVACELNKPVALDRLRDASKNYPLLEAVVLDTRYPHGAEKHLVKAVLDREIPLRALPGSVGVLVHNVQTVIALAEAIDMGKVLHSRVLTVSGHGINFPKNIRVPLGVSVKDIIDFCGGPSTDDPAVILGGPMTGILIDDLSLPIIKGTSGIILLTDQEYRKGTVEPCIRCGKCVEVCPMYLPPNRITAYINNDMIEEAQEAGLDACILCGACQFVCPSKRPLLQWIVQGKAAAASRKERNRS